MKPCPSLWGVFALVLVLVGCARSVSSQDDSSTDSSADIQIDITTFPDNTFVDVLDRIEIADALDIPTRDSETNLDAADVVDASFPDDSVVQTCALALQRPAPLSNGEHIVGRATGTSHVNNSFCDSIVVPSPGPEVLYRLDVPTQMVVELSTAGPLTGRTDTLLSIRRTCDLSFSDIVCSNNTSSTDLSSRIRTELQPGTYYVLVDRADSHDPFDFDLWVSTSTPTGTACTDSIPLLANVTRTYTLPAASNATPACRPTENAPQRFHRFTIPPASTATFVVSSTNRSFAPTVRVLSDCAATTCLASSGAGVASSETLTYSTGNSPQDVVVSVGGPASAASQSYSIMTTVSATSPGDVCASAQQLQFTGTLPDSFVGPLTTSSPCESFPTAYSARYYRVTLPPLSTATITLSGPGIRSGTSLQVIDTCDAQRCVARAQASSSGMVSINATNPTTALRHVIVLAAAPPSVIGFTVTAQLTTTTTFVNCATPFNLPTTEPIDDIYMTSMTNSLAAVCVPSISGGTYYFRLTVPPRHSAVVSHYGVLTFLPFFRLVNACPPTQCLDNASNNLAITNTDTTAHDYLIAVSARSSAQSGTFGLNAVLTPL